MKRLLSCAFSFEAGCVALRFSDGMIAIGVIAVENRRTFERGNDLKKFGN